MNEDSWEARVRELEKELRSCAWSLVYDAVQALDGNLGGYDDSGWEADIKEAHRIWREVLHWDEKRIAEERALICEEISFNAVDEDGNDLGEWNWEAYNE